jgi:exodeoxyribonuclease V gamma subunit
MNPMSSLFLAADAEVLADQLAHEVKARQSPKTFLVPQTIVVPNRVVEQWLKLHLARKLDVAVNLRFRFLEQALWDNLVAVDPRSHPAPPELLDDATYRLLVLSTLLLGDDPELRPLQDFCERPSDVPGPEAVTRLSRLGSRRACDLAARVGDLIRDYEYHRQESIVQHWLHDELVFAETLGWNDRERAQRAVFRGITREPDGRRARLNRGAKRNLKTLPQYVAEMLHDVRDYRTPPPRCLHLFGLTQMSPLHLRALDVLAPFFDLRVYHVNPLASRLRAADRDAMIALAGAYRGSDRPDELPGTELLHIWGRAGAESLGLVADLAHKPSFRCLRLSRKSRPRKPETTVLARLQDQLLGRPDDGPRPTQDRSLEIIGCPGIWREVETVHAGIVDQLDRDPNLRQTDIAVFVADLDAYRPALKSVFERPPRLLAYNLGDFTADRLSVYGQGLLDILDLALESFTRSRVFDVLLNPCFLARLGVARSDAAHWLDWADELGIRHGWDKTEKKSQGLFSSDHYSWKLGLKRLRLGRYMQAVDDDVPATAWGNVIPFADVESADRENLDVFCRAVEGLLPHLARLRHARGTARVWADRVRQLMHRFLQVPEDRPAEESVRNSIFTALDHLQLWDELDDKLSLPLSLVREYLAGQIRDLAGRHNDLLAGGVTIASLRPQRAIPFQLVYLVGMGADHFPGTPFLSPLDLRSAQRQPGDILPVEHQRFALLETILATRRKLVVTYNERDLQKDQERQPAVPILQLKRHLEKQVVAGPFEITHAPLLAHDASYLAEPAPWQETLVQVRASDRLLALESVDRKKRLVLQDLHERCEIEEQHRSLARSFPVEPAPADEARVRHVPLRHLKEFLEDPAAAALKRRLRYDADEDADRPDHEPFVAPQRVASRLMRQLEEELIRRSETEPVADLVREWPDLFHARYREWMNCSRLPEHAFADVDEQHILAELTARIEGGAGLARFLEQQATKTAIGPILLGESLTPVGARRRFPAVDVGAARVVGDLPFAWQTDSGLEILVTHGGDIDRFGKFDRKLLAPLLGLVALTATDPSLDRGRFTMHVARPAGIDTFEVGGPLFKPAAARAYLDRLVRDFLDPACAELLPFSIVRTDWELRKSLFFEDYGNPDFARILADVISRESDFRRQDLAELAEAGFHVAEDPLRKIRDRFGPLQRSLEAPTIRTEEQDVDLDEEAFE